MNQYQVQEYEPFEPVQGKYYVIEMGKSGNLQKKVLGHLHKQRPYLEEVRSVEDCNVILVFCPIVSRAGTDIDAALNKLNTYSASKPAILMVFHYTFDPDKIVPDSSRFINRGNTLTVDCLFFEDVGLFTCNRNEEALAKIVQCFKYQTHSLTFSYILWYIFTKYLYPGCSWILGTVRKHTPEIVQKCFSYMLDILECLYGGFCWILGTVRAIWTRRDRGTCESITNIFPKCLYGGCSWILGTVRKHTPEIVQKCFSYVWNILECLYGGFCWILGTVRAIWTRRDRGTCESITNNERSRLIDADGEKTA